MSRRKSTPKRKKAPPPRHFVAAFDQLQRERRAQITQAEREKNLVHLSGHVLPRLEELERRVTNLEQRPNHALEDIKLSLRHLMKRLDTPE